MRTGVMSGQPKRPPATHRRPATGCGPIWKEDLYGFGSAHLETGRPQVVLLAGVVAAVLTLMGAASAEREPDPRASIAGFVLDHGRYRTVEHPEPATQMLAFGIDNLGWIVGAFDDAEGRSHGFVRERNGRFRTIDAPGVYATVATRINERGQIVGDAFTTKERFEQGLKRGFPLDRGRFVTVDVPGLPTRPRRSAWTTAAALSARPARSSRSDATATSGMTAGSRGSTSPARPSRTSRRTTSAARASAPTATPPW